MASDAYDKDLIEEPFIAAFGLSGKTPPSVKALQGYLAKSPRNDGGEDDWWRLYEDLDFDDYIDFRAADVFRSIKVGLVAGASALAAPVEAAIDDARATKDRLQAASDAVSKNGLNSDTEKESADAASDALDVIETIARFVPDATGSAQAASGARTRLLNAASANQQLLVATELDMLKQAIEAAHKDAKDWVQDTYTPGITRSIVWIYKHAVLHRSQSRAQHVQGSFLLGQMPWRGDSRDDMGYGSDPADDGDFSSKGPCRGYFSSKGPC